MLCSRLCLSACLSLRLSVCLSAYSKYDYDLSQTHVCLCVCVVLKYNITHFFSCFLFHSFVSLFLLPLLYIFLFWFCSSNLFSYFLFLRCSICQFVSNILICFLFFFFFFLNWRVCHTLRWINPAMNRSINQSYSFHSIILGFPLAFRWYLLYISMCGKQFPGGK